MIVQAKRNTMETFTFIHVCADNSKTVLDHHGPFHVSYNACTGLCLPPSKPRHAARRVSWHAEWLAWAVQSDSGHWPVCKHPQSTAACWVAWFPDSGWWLTPGGKLGHRTADRGHGRWVFQRCSVVWVGQGGSQWGCGQRGACGRVYQGVWVY
jgi:hypothetical protein